MNNFTSFEWLLLCLAGAAMLFCFGYFFHYIGKHPEFLEDDQELTSEKIPTSYSNTLLLSFYKGKWDMRMQILEAQPQQLSDIYWKIEQFDMDYRDIVPDHLLIKAVNELYDLHTRVAKDLVHKGQAVS